MERLYVNPPSQPEKRPPNPDELARLRRVFPLRQLTRQARLRGQIRLYNFGLYVDHGLSGQTVEVVMYDGTPRIEQAEHCPVSYPCVFDTRHQRTNLVVITFPPLGNEADLAMEEEQ